MVRASIESAEISWDQAATYQVFLRKALSVPIAAYSIGSTPAGGNRSTTHVNRPRSAGSLRKRGAAVKSFGWLNFAALVAALLVGTGAGAAGALGASPRGGAEAPDEEQWPQTGRDAGGGYYSPLADIDRRTVGRLGFAWEYRLGTKRGLEATPLMIDGAMYAVGNWGRVYSVDPATGKERWRYDPGVDGQWGRYACCDVVNRGLAASGGTIYVGALDGYLHAIDARTGARRWKVDTLIGRGQRPPVTLTGAPLIAGDLVIIGNAGADFKGVRGYVSAYDLKTGRIALAVLHGAARPEARSAGPAASRARDSNLGSAPSLGTGGGGTVWDGMSYDPEAKLRIYRHRQRMRRTPSRRTGAEAATTFTPTASSRSMPTRAAWPGTTRPCPATNGTTMPPRR